MKTIRGLAEELGVSKTAVVKTIDKLGLRSGLRMIGNQFAIDEEQENLIRRRLSGELAPGESQTKNANRIDNQSQTDNQIRQLVCVLEKTISALQAQLEAKDRQLEAQARQMEKLTDALATAQRTAAAEQALHAGTMQKQLTSEPQIHPEPSKKAGWLGRIFGR